MKKLLFIFTTFILSSFIFSQDLRTLLGKEYMNVKDLIDELGDEDFNVFDNGANPYSMETEKYLLENGYTAYNCLDTKSLFDKLLSKTFPELYEKFIGYETLTFAFRMPNGLSYNSTGILERLDLPPLIVYLHLIDENGDFIVSYYKVNSKLESNGEVIKDVVTEDGKVHLGTATIKIWY